MGHMFGDYRLVRRIAAGGMGEVYLAMLEREGGFAKAVALKMMLPGCAERPGFAELFESEAALAAMLNHANIVQIFDHGCIDGRSFLSMELVEGPDLAALIEARGGAPLPPALVCEIGLQLCRALGHAHERRDLHGRPLGIVHGDISPPNILVTLDGQVKLADFGLARLLANTIADGRLTGKYSYMSPEQARARPIEPRSDLFSLGLVLYELACGLRAYPLKESPELTLAAVRAGTHPPPGQVRPDLPESLQAAIERALEADIERRFESAGAMSAALAEACPPCGPETLAAFVRAELPGFSSAASPEPTELADTPLAAGRRPRRGWIAGLAALFVIGWGAAAGLWIFHRPPGPIPRPPVSKLPQAPAGLKVERVGIAAQPVQPIEPDTHTVKRRVVAARHRQPKPPREGLRIELPRGFSAMLDNHPIGGRRLAMRGPRPHLLWLKSLGGRHAEVRARFEPPTAERDWWIVSLRANPWMRITIGGRAAGQTPRSRLKLGWGTSRVVLTNEAGSLKLEIESRRSSNKGTRDNIK